jgi:hypothetical protein
MADSGGVVLFAETEAAVDEEDRPTRNSEGYISSAARMAAISSSP